MIKISAGKCYVCYTPMVVDGPDHLEVELYGAGYQNICIGCYENLQEHHYDEIKNRMEQAGLTEKG